MDYNGICHLLRIASMSWKCHMNKDSHLTGPICSGSHEEELRIRGNNILDWLCRPDGHRPDHPFLKQFNNTYLLMSKLDLIFPGIDIIIEATFYESILSAELGEDYLNHPDINKWAFPHIKLKSINSIENFIKIPKEINSISN